MALNITKQETAPVIDVKLKTLTTGILKEFFNLEKDLKSEDNEKAARASFKVVKLTTNLTDEQIENLSLDDFTEILEVVTKEMDSFTKTKKKEGFQKPLTSSVQS